MAESSNQAAWKTTSIIVQCSCGARFQSVAGHPLVRCAACLAVTDLRIYNAPTPPQAALAPIEPKNKARVEDKDESSSEQAVNLEAVPEAATEKAPNLLQPIQPIQPMQPQPLIEKVEKVEEIDPEYASDDEAVKEAIRQGKYRRKIRARDVLLVLALVAVAIATVVVVVVLGVKFGKQSGGGSKPTLAVIVAAVLFVLGIVAFGIQEWRFRRISHLTVVTELWCTFGYIFFQGAGFLVPFYLGLLQDDPPQSRNHWWSLLVETIDCLILTALFYCYLRFRLPRLPFYKYMSPPGTFCAWFALAFAPQVIVWIGIGVWRNAVSTSSAAIFACAGTLWAASIIVTAVSNRGLFLTAACATSSLTAFVWNFSHAEALAPWIVIFVICAVIIHWPRTSRPCTIRIYTVSIVWLSFSVLFQIVNRFKRPDVSDDSMPIFGSNSVLRAQDALFLANLFWIPAYVRDRDTVLPFILALSVVFTSPVWATAFWGVLVVILALWTLLTRTVPWLYTRLLFMVVLGSWYAWGWLCDWDTARDRTTVLVVAYALIVVGTLMDLRALDILPLSSQRWMRGSFRPHPDAYSSIGFIVLEVPKSMHDVLHSLSDVIIQVDKNTTDAIGGWLKDFLEPEGERRVVLRVLSLKDHSLRNVEVPASEYCNIKARSDYLGGICDSFCKVTSVADGSATALAGIQPGQILFGPLSSDRVLRRALFGRRGFRIATYASSDPPQVFSKKRIAVPTKKGQEIRDDPFAVIGLSIAPSNAWSLPKSLDLTDDTAPLADGDKPYIPESALGHLFVNSNNVVLGNFTLALWVIATCVSVLSFKANYQVFTFVLAVSYLAIAAVQAVWLRLVRLPRASDVRAVATIYVIITAAMLWFIVGYRANPWTRHGTQHHLNIEMWTIVSLFVAIALSSGWFQRAEKEWELRGIWTSWVAEKQQPSDANATRSGALADRILSLILWCGIPYLLFAALLAVWPSHTGFADTLWTPVLLLLVPCAYTLVTPLLPYQASAGKVAVASAFMLVCVAVVPRVLIGIGDAYSQESQNWRARLAFDAILAGTVVVSIPLQLLRSIQPHPGLVAAYCCIAMLTSYLSVLLLVVLIVLSALIIALGANNEDSKAWALFWIIPIVGSIRSLEFLFWRDDAAWKFMWIGVIGIFLLVWCFMVTLMYKKEHRYVAICRFLLACVAAFLLLQWSHGIVLAVIGLVYLGLPKNNVVAVWYILPSLFFPAVWAVLGTVSAQNSYFDCCAVSDWESNKWPYASIVPAGISLFIATLSSPLLARLNLLRNSVKSHTAAIYRVHEYSCIVALIWGLLTYWATKGGLGLAIVAIVIIHACVVRHWWWLFTAAPLVSLGVWLVTVACDNASTIAAGIAAAVTAGVIFTFGVALFRRHRWFIFGKERTPDEILQRRHKSGRMNPAVAYYELTFTVLVEVAQDIYLIAGVFMALQGNPYIGCAVLSGTFLFLLCAKILGGARTWPSIPSEIYWVAIVAFAIASGFSSKTYGIMPIVVCVAFAIACLVDGYLCSVFIYPGVTAALSAVAALSIRDDASFCAVAAGWGAALGALLCILARITSGWHHFGFTKDPKEGEPTVRISSDACPIHAIWPKKHYYYITVEITAALWYLAAGVVIYLGTMKESRFGHRVGYALVLCLLGTAHTVTGFMRHQKWRKHGGLALVVVAFIFGAFIQNKTVFRLIFFSLMALVVLFILLLFVYPIIRNWCRNVPDDDIEMGQTSFGIPSLEMEHQLVPDPTQQPPATATVQTQDRDELEIPTGIAIPQSPEHASIHDNAAEALVPEAGESKADRAERRAQKKAKKERKQREREEAANIQPIDGAAPQPEPVPEPEAERDEAEHSENRPLLKAEPVIIGTVDNVQWEGMRKRMSDMEQRLKRSEEEQALLRSKIDQLLLSGKHTPATVLATASQPRSTAPSPPVSLNSDPSSAAIPTGSPLKEKRYGADERPVKFHSGGTIAHTNVTCPYSQCRHTYDYYYYLSSNEYVPPICPSCRKKVAPPERLVQARKDMKQKNVPA